MAVATQAQVRLAIDRGGASGTAAEVLAAITDKTIQKTLSKRMVYSDVAKAFDAVGQNGDAITDQLRDELRANGPKYLADQMAGSGADFSDPKFQSSVDAMASGSSPRLLPQVAAVLKGMGVWSESPLEHHNATRGLTTDEAHVQAVLDEIAAETSVAARREVMRVAYNAAVIVLDNGGTLDDVKAIFASMGN